MGKLVCGSNRIAGCSFSIHPMCDDFKNIITTALKNVDTSKVWMQTDDVSTLVRGRIPHIFDVTKAIYLHAANTGVHVAFEATYSVGCPGDTTGDVFMAEDDVVLNKEKVDSIKQDASTKFALYPLGGGEYMDQIYAQIEAMKDHGVNVSSSHYATRLDGEVVNIFNGLEKVFIDMEESGSSHTVMTVSISANSPSTKGGKANA